MFAAIAALSLVSYPEPPLQTPTQLAAWKAKAAIAKAASDKATPALLEFLGSADLRAALKVCCPAAASMSAQALLERLRSETYSAELAHSFPISVETGPHHHGFYDETLDFLAERPTFMNQWQCRLLLNSTNGSALPPPLRFDPRVESPNGFDPNLAETNIFGCPGFAVAGRPTWTEASSRLIYIAHNLRQLDTGSTPWFGPVAALFRTEAVKHMVLIAALDTGIWEASCNKSAGGGGPIRPLNCSYWPLGGGLPLGTLEHADHVLLANLGLWSTAGSHGSLVAEAAKVFGRSPMAHDGGDAYARLAAIDGDHAERYYESNLVGNPRVSSIKLLLPTFGALFGTDAGKRVRAVASQRGLPMAWALGDATDGHFKSVLPNESYPGNQRLLDPSSAALLNVSLPPEASQGFDAAWAAVAAARNASGTAEPTQRDIRGWWAELRGVARGALPRLAPLQNASCADASGCVGIVVGSGECVCAI